MKKVELINAIANEAGVTKKDASKTLDAILKSITTALQNNEKISLVGFGTFEVVDRPEKEGRNPKTGEPMTIKATRIPKFKPGQTLKDQVNE